jgi:large subunit ribosomal protein L22
MEAKAVAKGMRISADKARLVIDLIRNKDILKARAVLKNLNKKAARIIEKVLESSIANAKNNLNLDEAKLYITEAYVNEGTILKRIKFDSRSHIGRKDRRTSHITIIVSERQ